MYHLCFKTLLVRKLNMMLNVEGFFLAHEGPLFETFMALRIRARASNWWKVWKWVVSRIIKQSASALISKKLSDLVVPQEITSNIEFGHELRADFTRCSLLNTYTGDVNRFSWFQIYVISIHGALCSQNILRGPLK